MLVIFQTICISHLCNLVAASAVEVRFAEALFRCRASVEIIEEDFGTVAIHLRRRPLEIVRAVLSTGRRLARPESTIVEKPGPGTLDVLRIS
jgi:hypothetical protein